MITEKESPTLEKVYCVGPVSWGGSLALTLFPQLPPTGFFLPYPSFIFGETAWSAWVAPRLGGLSAIAAAMFAVVFIGVLRPVGPARREVALLTVALGAIGVLFLRLGIERLIWLPVVLSAPLLFFESRPRTMTVAMGTVTLMILIGLIAIRAAFGVS